MITQMYHSTQICSCGRVKMCDNSDLRKSIHVDVVPKVPKVVQQCCCSPGISYKSDCSMCVYAVFDWEHSTFDMSVLEMGIIVSDYFHVTGRVHLRVLCHVLCLDAHTAVRLSVARMKYCSSTGHTTCNLNLMSITIVVKSKSCSLLSFRMFQRALFQEYNIS